MSASASSAARTWSRFWHWQIRLAPAARMSAANVIGSPNESITAAGSR